MQSQQHVAELEGTCASLTEANEELTTEKKELTAANETLTTEKEELTTALEEVHDGV